MSERSPNCGSGQWCSGGAHSDLERDSEDPSARFCCIYGDVATFIVWVGRYSFPFVV